MLHHSSVHCISRLYGGDEVGVEVEHPLSGRKCSGSIAEGLQQQCYNVLLTDGSKAGAYVDGVVFGRVGESSEMDICVTSDGRGGSQQLCDGRDGGVRFGGVSAVDVSQSLRSSK